MANTKRADMRFDEETVALLSQLSEHLGVNKTAVVKQAVRELARKEGIAMRGSIRIHPADGQGAPLPSVLQEHEISFRFVVKGPTWESQHGYVKTEEGKYALVRQGKRDGIWDIILRDPVNEEDIEKDIRAHYASWEWIDEEK